MLLSRREARGERREGKHSFLQRVASGLSPLASCLRSITGMPRYDDYLAHMRCKHPEQVPLSERDYFNQYLEHRYAGGPTRCC